MNANQIANELEEWVLDFTNDIAKQVYKGARKRTPVRSGRAQRGWQIDYTNKLGVPAIVSNDVPYITYLEHGTVHMAPVHMVRATLIEIGNRNR